MLLREDEVSISFETADDQCRVQMPTSFMMADTYTKQLIVGITIASTTLDALRRLIEEKDAIEAAASGDFEREEEQ